MIGDILGAAVLNVDELIEMLDCFQIFWFTIIWVDSSQGSMTSRSSSKIIV